MNNLTKKTLVLGLLAVLLLANIWIWSSTKSKHRYYSEHPPFFALDFSRLHTLSRSSQVYHLIDGNPKTHWIKGEESQAPFDFDVELRLTHDMKEGILLPRQFREISLRGCGENMNSFSMEFYKREAIHIDEEKRLPEDFVLWRGIVIVAQGETKIPIADKLPTWETSTGIGKDSGVWILGIRGKAPNATGCLAGISLNQ